ncbi:MAG: holo-ACP synthase [Planctomycetota bacterium]
MIGKRVVAHGVDLIEVARVAELLESQGERFLERCFDPGEVAYADANPARRVEHLAVRFAAKEAVMKCLGTGWGQGVGWRDIVVTRDASGRPGVSVSGGAGEHANRLAIGGWLLSLSHTETMAMASAIALGVDPPRD